MLAAVWRRGGLVVMPKHASGALARQTVARPAAGPGMGANWGVPVQTFKTKSSLRKTIDAGNVLGSGGVMPRKTLGVSLGLGSLLGALQANPFTAQVTIATVKTSIADMMVQKRVEDREAIDWRRNALFIMFGGAYLGVFQWFVYVRLFQRLFPAMNTFCNQSVREKLRNREGIKALFGQIALDFTLIQPFVYFPVFYMFKTLLDPDVNSLSERLSQTWKSLTTNFWADNLGMCGFWLPMDLIIYSVPVYLRLPLNHAISFIWCCVLSVFRGGEEKAITTQ